MSKDADEAFQDMMHHGTGFILNGKHVPLGEVFVMSKEPVAWRWRWFETDAWTVSDWAKSRDQAKEVGYEVQNLYIEEVLEAIRADESAKERGRCANLCEALMPRSHDPGEHAKDIAAAIRAQE